MTDMDDIKIYFTIYAQYIYNNDDNKITHVFVSHTNIRLAFTFHDYRL